MAESGFARQTLPQLIVKIRNDVLARLQTDDVLRRQDAEVNARVMAAVSHSILGVIDSLAVNLLPDQCDESWLERHARLKKCPRKQPSAAAGYARWEVVSGAVTVPAGRLLLDPEGREYETTEAASASAGLIRAPVRALLTGGAGNLDDGVELRLVSPVAGLSSLAVADGLTGGGDLEELETWRGRVMARYWWVPHGGAGTDYEQSAVEVPGVTRAWFLRHFNGPGTITVAVAADAGVDPIPGVPLLNAVRAHIESWSSVVSDELYVIAPLPGALNPTIRLSPDTPETRAAVEASLRDFLRREGGLRREADEPARTLPLSRISEAISGGAGEYSHALISPAVAPTYAWSELPVLGVITWET